ncbi:Fimbrial assembly protein (PilN) [compost metagenome]
MAGVNLLPWREQLRGERRKRFVAVLAGVCVLAAVIVVGVEQYLRAAVDRQAARNGYLQHEIGEVAARIKQLDEVKQQRRKLLERLQVIEDLQGNRSEMAQLFDQLARALPEGVYFTALTRADQTLAITGMAESNGQVSQFMRNLEASALFRAPSLAGVKAASDEDSVPAGAFRLSVSQAPARLAR